MRSKDTKLYQLTMSTMVKSAKVSPKNHHAARDILLTGLIGIFVQLENQFINVLHNNRFLITHTVLRECMRKITSGIISTLLPSVPSISKTICFTHISLL